MKKKRYLVIVILFVFLVVAANSFFLLYEDECAIVQRFGEIIGIYVKNSTDTLYNEIAVDSSKSINIHEGTGLKFKIPFIDGNIKYSIRLRTDDTPGRSIITSDKKTLYFDSNAQWRIENPMRFFMAVGTYSTASGRIDNILYSLMNEKVGKVEATVLITGKERTEQMLNELAAEVNMETHKFGVNIIGINIKRTDVPQENYESIHNRMNSERGRIAAQYRSEGEEEAIKIRSNTDREVTVIKSEAYSTAEKIRGEGDSEAARIYNEAYGKDPEFFEFYNLLQTYRATIGDKTTLIMPIDSPFTKYLLGADGGYGGSGNNSGTGAVGGD
jgi:membrane protease subunit HflC